MFRDSDPASDERPDINGQITELLEEDGFVLTDKTIRVPIELQEEFNMEECLIARHSERGFTQVDISRPLGIDDLFRREYIRLYEDGSIGKSVVTVRKSPALHDAERRWEDVFNQWVDELDELDDAGLLDKDLEKESVAKVFADVSEHLERLSNISRLESLAETAEERQGAKEQREQLEEKVSDRNKLNSLALSIYCVENEIVSNPDFDDYANTLKQLFAGFSEYFKIKSSDLTESMLAAAEAIKQLDKCLLSIQGQWKLIADLDNLSRLQSAP